MAHFRIFIIAQDSSGKEILRIQSNELFTQFFSYTGYINIEVGFMKELSTRVALFIDSQIAFDKIEYQKMIQVTGVDDKDLRGRQMCAETRHPENRSNWHFEGRTRRVYRISSERKD